MGEPNNTFFASEPGGREAAPGSLALVQAFVNTVATEGELHWEAFADPDSLRSWLAGRGLLVGGAALEPGEGGVEGAVGRVLAAAHAGMQNGTWGRLKICANGGCAWAFYDRSRNRSSRWCSMAICGNRTKTRAYRQRRSAAPG